MDIIRVAAEEVYICCIRVPLIRKLGVIRYYTSGFGEYPNVRLRKKLSTLPQRLIELL